jgi:hypothetical protein
MFNGRRPEPLTLAASCRIPLGENRLHIIGGSIVCRHNPEFIIGDRAVDAHQTPPLGTSFGRGHQAIVAMEDS